MTPFALERHWFASPGDHIHTTGSDLVQFSPTTLDKRTDKVHICLEAALPQSKKMGQEKAPAL